MADVFQFLKSATVDQVMQPAEGVFRVQGTDTLLSAFKILQENNILSVPVFEGEKIFSFLDLIDILHYAVENHDLKSALCSRVCDYSKLNPFVTIKSGSNLIKMCEIFCITYQNLHRVAVLNDAGEFVGMITISKIIRYFAPHVKHFDFGNSDIRVLNLGSRRKYLSVKDTDTVSQTIQSFYSQKYSSAAVVDAKGKLVGNFSATDLKLFGSPLQIQEMLKTTLNDIIARVDRPHKGPLFVHQTTTCHLIVEKLESEKIHQVYVVDEESLPIGIIWSADILELFWRALVIC